MTKVLCLPIPSLRSVMGNEGSLWPGRTASSQGVRGRRDQRVGRFGEEDEHQGDDGDPTANASRTAPTGTASMVGDALMVLVYAIWVKSLTGSNGAAGL
ncbi:hypothetical protein AB0L00_38265, partial [Actinoallomurus sp. NPDC052308]|uniref:hypothetical protein n=1 Tax=Actinoallomurus sp. NPDC052308 TaxID=3155530 RepID=UPI003447341B